MEGCNKVTMRIRIRINYLVCIPGQLVVLHFSFPLAFGTPQQSIESIIGMGHHVTNGVDVGDGGGSVGDDGGGGGYGGLIVVA